MPAILYRCPQKCPIRKQCFILKTENPIKEPIRIWKKCPAAKKDILITIGENRPP